MDRAHCVIAHSLAPHLRLGLAYTQVPGINDFRGHAFVAGVSALPVQAR